MALPNRNKGKPKELGRDREEYEKRCRIRFRDRFKDLNNNQMGFSSFTNNELMQDFWLEGTTGVKSWYKYFLLATLIQSLDLVDWMNLSSWALRHHNLQQMLLFELYCDQPETFLAMLQRLEGFYSERLPTWLKSLSSQAPQSSAYSADGAIGDQHFQKIFGTVEEMKMSNPELSQRQFEVNAFFDQVYARFKRKREHDTFFKEFLSRLSPQIDLCDLSLERPEFPVFLAIDQEVFEAVQNYLSELDEKIAEFLSKWKPPKDEGPSLLSSESGKVNLLFAVAGSGKTRNIKLLLSENWGFYLLPCNLPPGREDNLYAPRRTTGSSDTWTLWMLVNNSRTFYPKIDIKQDPTWKWYWTLLLSRMFILDRFLKKFWETGDLHGPAKWFAFQTSCSSSFDPFNTLFQLLILVSSVFESLYNRPTMPYIRKLINSKRLCFCIDEAQCDLEQCDPGLVNWTLPMLRIELGCILNMTFGPYLKPMAQDIFIAGTSLRISEAISTIQDVKWYDLNTERILMSGCKAHIDFPLLTTKENFEELLEQHDILVPKPYLTHVEKCSAPLRGRYRWSVRYVDRLKPLQPNGWTPKAIKNAAEEATIEAKDQLKNRLIQLEKQNQARLLDQLCQVAIQSDLLDKPTIFEDDKDCEMISEAFAVVKPIGEDQNQYRSQLKEQLALEAVIEFFRDHRTQQYDEKLRHFLVSQQNDASALGKVAEWFLAWELRKCLHGSQRMTGSPENILCRRKNILANLGKAEHLVKVENLKQRHKYLEDYCLLEGEKTGHCYDQRPKDIRIDEWMASIRNGKKPAASFYFPDNLAGPDILFALKCSKMTKETPGDGVILCIVQLKIGKTESVRDAIKTTNPIYWYTGTNSNAGRDEQRKYVEKELGNWQHRTILRVLITTAVTTREQAHPSADKRTSDNEYFVRLDKGQTESLFGATFCRLVEAMKNKEKDMKKLDEMTHGKRKRNDPDPVDPRVVKKSRRR